MAMVILFWCCGLAVGLRIKAGLLQRFLVRIVSNSLVPAENVLFVICVSKNEAKNIQNFLSFAKGAAELRGCK